MNPSDYIIISNKIIGSSSLPYLDSVQGQKICRCKPSRYIESNGVLQRKQTVKKKRSRRKVRLLAYPELNESISKTFQIKYEKKLSPIAKLVLNSFQNKYIYYAIDDILYSFKSNPHERDNLLEILYSPVLSLQNNFSINFFDIWINEIYIDEVSKVNKFLNNDSLNFEQFSYITIKFLCKTSVPIKKPDSIW